MLCRSSVVAFLALHAARALTHRQRLNIILPSAIYWVLPDLNGKIYGNNWPVWVRGIISDIIFVVSRLFPLDWVSKPNQRGKIAYKPSLI